MGDLVLPVKKEYFDAIKSGEKIYENRLVNDYWKKRLIGRKYDRVIITLGYPKKTDQSRRLIFPYQGYIQREIQHKHFGDQPVQVFSLRLQKGGSHV